MEKPPSPIHGFKNIKWRNHCLPSMVLKEDPLHLLVYQIFSNFAGCPYCSRRFHNLYNNPCYSTNPWHHLWPSTFNKISIDPANSIGHFGGSTISHLKFFSFISNRYFTEFHFVSWFVRYDHLKLHMFLHISATRTTNFEKLP